MARSSEGYHFESQFWVEAGCPRTFGLARQIQALAPFVPGQLDHLIHQELSQTRVPVFLVDHHVFYDSSTTDARLHDDERRCSDEIGFLRKQYEVKVRADQLSQTSVSSPVGQLLVKIDQLEEIRFAGQRIVPRFNDAHLEVA